MTAEMTKRHPVAIFLRSSGSFGSSEGLQTRVAKPWRRDPELDQSDQHADPGRRKTIMPAKPFAFSQRAADQWTNHRTDIDAHIENGESGVPTGITGRVQLADDGTDVWFQQARAEHHEYESDEERVYNSARPG